MLVSRGGSAGLVFSRKRPPRNTLWIKSDRSRALRGSHKAILGKKNVRGGPSMKIAIVGGGISGLVAARELCRTESSGTDSSSISAAVTVFEADARLGGHTNTIPVDLVGGGTVAVDTGFIVFNEQHYPEFSRLLEELNVESHVSDMSFSVRCDRSGLEYNGSDINRIFAQRSNLLRPSFYRFLADILRFNRSIKSDVETLSDDLTVGEFLARGGYGRSFGEKYLIPLAASLWSSPPREVEGFSMTFVAEFLLNHNMLDAWGRPTWRVVTGGSSRYLEPLVRPFADRVRLSAPVERIERSPEGVWVTASGCEPERFDHVVVACHADQALSMIHDPRPVERELLSCFPYQKNIATLHTDVGVLPRRRRAWASWNYRIPIEDRDTVAVTYQMNFLQRLKATEQYLVTLNDPGEVDPGKILSEINYHHPIFKPGRAEAQRRHPEVIDLDGVSYCGAYWGYGFHEDGVASGLRVARELARELAKDRGGIGVG